jgi:hypothetical protein
MLNAGASCSEEDVSLFAFKDSTIDEESKELEHFFCFEMSGKIFFSNS